MALFGVLTLAVASSIGSNCHSTAGFEKLWASYAQRWLIVGEDHGTNEEPEAFFNLVCQASAKREVTVAVEQAASEQAAIDTFISSNGDKQARDTFLKSPIWYGTFRDGRSSRAYFLLFERLRALHQAGRVRSVIAFQPAGAADAGSYEKAMAEELVRHSPPKSFTIALVGSVHAMRTAVSFGGPPYLPMAGNLPASQTMTIEMKGAGGRQWACQSPTDCGPSEVEQEGGPPPVGLNLTTNAKDPYSGTLGLNGPTTASEPQIPAR